MYRYSFDETRAGNWRLSRSQYELVQRCYRALLDRIEEWNRVALSQGALDAPYSKEAGDLKRMIEWGNEQLENQQRMEIVVNGISVGSLRYAKAALLYTAKVRETKAAAAAGSNWPTAVKNSVQDVGKPMRVLAEKIAYPPAEILTEVAADGATRFETSAPEWDLFISHANEDKESFVTQLARELTQRGLKVWYDSFTLKLGDSLRQSIDRGLANSRFGVVVLSPNFFRKAWPQRELDGLIAREADGKKVLLPVWHEIDAVGIRAYSPLLADRVAVSSIRGIDEVVEGILEAIDLKVPA